MTDAMPTKPKPITQEQAEAMAEALQKLVEWAGHMGGWDAPCWAEATRVLRDVRKTLGKRVI